MDTHSPQAATSSFAEIPLIDLAPLKDGRQASRSAVAAEICKACESVGFLYLANHGIAASLMDDMFGVARQFFALPLEEKMPLKLGAFSGFRGYLPAGVEGGTMAGNRKEVFQIINEQADDGAGTLDPMWTQSNLWPASFPTLRKVMLQYLADVERLSLTLLQLFAIGLEVPETTFSSRFNSPINMLRLLHYPPQAPTDKAIGSQPHTDSGALTILAQDDAGGLESVDDLGQWSQVKPIKNTLVVNLGEMLKLWSDGRFRATPHRVVNASGTDRISIPFFASPDIPTLIQPVIRAQTRKDEIQLVGHLERGTPKTSGEIMSNSWHRLWGGAKPASY
ncbi:MAG TPA: 2-oxoglutarate and iron-dependent oxygenase domain-containing protein [Bordetella sp.]